MKIVLAPALCWLLWVEVEMAVRASSFAGPVVRSLTQLGLALAFVFGCAFVVWWSFADQRRRCPICLQLLSMPVTLGSWGSVLDPAMTETFCDSGHGTLCQPESVEGLPDHWTRMDSSWSELFGGKK